MIPALIIISLVLGAVVLSEHRRRYDFMLLERSFEGMRSILARDLKIPTTTCCYKCTNDIGQGADNRNVSCDCKCHNK